MINIATTLCVDVDDIGNHTYGAIVGDKNIRRESYWKCVMVFFLTSIRVNKDQHHIVFTNDEEDIIIDGIDIKAKLKELGVEIYYLLFQYFDPKHRSRIFRNTYYRYDIMKELATLDRATILLDSDCVWTQRQEKIFDLIENQNKVLLKDLVHDDLDEKEYKGRMGELSNLDRIFKSQITLEDYSLKDVKWYGGECIGASPDNFKMIADGLADIFSYCIKKYDLSNNSVNNEYQIWFDSAERINSYVYNTVDIDIENIQDIHIRRIATGDFNFQARTTDVNIPIWHLIHEKTNAFYEMFDDLTNQKSLFWSISDEQIPYYLGAFVGIPNKYIRLKKYHTEYELKKLQDLDWAQFASMDTSNKLKFLLKKIMRK